MTTNHDKNIVLIGFMASGKTRIGKLLARELGFSLIDCDEVIVKEEGMPIKDIFLQKGESYFRQVESRVIKNLLGQKNAVIVTGGGAPMFFDNAINLQKLGFIFFLDANFSLIEKRLSKNSKRPLATLYHDQDNQQLKQLFHYRRPIYTALGHCIDVNQQDDRLACEEIMGRYKSLCSLDAVKKTLVLDPTHPYPIYHQSGIIKKVKTIIDALGYQHHRVAIITTHHLKNILADTINDIRASLPGCMLTTFNDGEEHKNMASVMHIYEEMFKNSLNRETLILALGGGNVGDVAGFVAGIFMRGVPFMQIPTTLLAMTDASIGGKTGVDNVFGKNLIGLFNNPKAVIIDPELLKTLSSEDFSCGMAEIIKHAMIADKTLFYNLFDNKPLEEIIARSLKVKADIVFSDPQEKNIRAHLNLGHTFAHAIETVSDYKIKHGLAVAMGLVLAVRLSKRLGILTHDIEPDLIKLLKHHNLPYELPPNIATTALVEAMKYDKKMSNRGLNFIVLKDMEEVIIHPVEEKDIF